MNGRERKPLAFAGVSWFPAAVILLPAVLASCAGAAPGSGADPSGAYQFTLDGLYSGIGSLSINVLDGECTGWATHPGVLAGVELASCRPSRGGVSFTLRPAAASGLDIVVSAKVKGRNLEGRWSTQGRSGLFLARSTRW